jgi:predicted NAD/FAD-binding protein
VRRLPESIEVISAGGRTERFDRVIIAAHSNQALAMLEKPTPLELEILGAIPYQENNVMLHTDSSVLPERPWIWASWNYLIPYKKQERVVCTYNMNILQGIRAPHDFCVTLNRADCIAEESVIGNYIYHHPIYTTASAAAQRRHDEVSGADRIHYCGAYLGYGFHEDGVRSALAVCRNFGKEL